ncbi:uncharacterized protein LOC124630716 [Helicoverpa zea]|uniref:uncharacterized protein LOC124630716 n=1 Tax=Helicoverpa zea TaxID=7113 RepID=UPI001F597BDE|nr:uncharacterized protein LOC124630716 [Helicoverpa zea]
MLKSIPIFLTFFCVSAQLRETNEALPLSPVQIKQSFDNVMTDEYINILAKDFAIKAAEHFVKELGNQKTAMSSKLSQISRSPIAEVSMGALQNQQKPLQQAEPEDQALPLAQEQGLSQVQEQALSQAQEQPTAEAIAQAQIQAKQNAKVVKRVLKKAKEKQKPASEVQAEFEEKGEEVEEPPIKPTKNQNGNNIMLDSDEALNLLKEPEPDGDHLDSQSGELSKEAARERIPVVQVMKINGAYYRRLLGLI